MVKNFSKIGIGSYNHALNGIDKEKNFPRLPPPSLLPGTAIINSPVIGEFILRSIRNHRYHYHLATLIYQNIIRNQSFASKISSRNSGETSQRTVLLNFPYHRWRARSPNVITRFRGSSRWQFLAVRLLGRGRGFTRTIEKSKVKSIRGGEGVFGDARPRTLLEFP